MIERLIFTCPGLADEGTFPLSLTGRGQDLSPELLLRNLSPAARTLAVTLEDTSHPIRNFTHWLLWNFPAAERIPGGLPAGKSLPGWGGARQGVAYGLHRYAGPKPPRGKTHVYRLTAYALDCALPLGPWTNKRRFLRSAQGHILQMGSLTARFA